MEYLVRRARASATGPCWDDAGVAAITHFHPASSDHRPDARARMLYDDRGVHIRFDVSDRYLICRHTQPQSPVCQDSCVEAFLQPGPGCGYFNFETNCGGAMLLYYITDARRIDGKIQGFRPVDAELMGKIRIAHSMPSEVPVEIDQPTEWWVELFVPNEVFEAYVGPLGASGKRRWRGNFYKCADESSHPHWASWSPIGEALNFHVPERFGEIRFESD